MRKKYYYHVGNCIIDQYTGINRILKEKKCIDGHLRHIGVGAPLWYLWKEEDKRPPYPFYEMGPNYKALFKKFSFEALILLPYQHNRKETKAAEDFYNLALENNTSCKLYVIQSYPRSLENDWEDIWLGSERDSKEAFNKTFFDIKNKFPDNECYQVPLGECVYTLKRKIENNEVEELKSFDDLFFNTDLTMEKKGGRRHFYKQGMYMFSCLIYSALYKEKPHGAATTGLEFHKYNKTGGYSVSDKFAKIAWDLVWEVLCSNSHTGIKP